MSRRRTILKDRLDTLYATYGGEFVSSDPLMFPTRFKSAGDKEVVGLLAASLAYGRVDQIKKSVQAVLDVMGDEPCAFVKAFDWEKDGALFKTFKHRFNTGKDIACLLYFMRQMIEDAGSIGSFFTEGYSKDDGTIKTALTSFTERALALDTGGIYGTKRLPPDTLPKEAGVRYFFPSPAGGSACKRLNLYLRWMVRRRDVDFGVWKSVSPAALIIPLDTHMARLSRLLGLTTRKSADWRMAEEVTDALRELDRLDPVKYDFALTRLGILEECPSHHNPEKCKKCLIKEVCTL